MTAIVYILAALAILPSALSGRVPSTLPDDGSVAVTVADRKSGEPLQGAVVKLPEFGLLDILGDEIAVIG